MKLRNLYTTARTLGCRATGRYAIARASEGVRGYFDSRFDRRYQVDTAGLINLATLKIESAHAKDATWYEATPVSVVRQLLDSLPIRYEDYVFIDCGSGKGRPMLIASEYPFSRVIGVEFSPDLHASAEKNIQSYRNPRQRCFRISSVCEDAVHYQWPNEPAVVFLFSPFQPPLFEKVLNGILASVQAYPRSIYLVYYGAMQACIQLLQQSGLECREVKIRSVLAARSRARVGLILHNPNPVGTTLGGSS